MNKKVKMLIGIVAFAVLLVGAFFVYKDLTNQYNSKKITEQTPEKKATEGNANNTVESTPELTVLDQEDNQVMLSSMKGKPTVLNFWASWCPYCVAEMPDFQAVYEDLGTEVNFMMINVTDGERETKDKAIAFMQDKGFSFPVYYDTKLEASSYFGAYALPMTIILDGEGKVVDGIKGKTDEATLRSMIEGAM